MKIFKKGGGILKVHMVRKGGQPKVHVRSTRGEGGGKKSWKLVHMVYERPPSSSDRQIVEGEIFQNYGGKVVTYYNENFFSKSWILCHMASTSIAQCKQTKKIWTCNIRSHELKWFCPKKCIEFMVVQCIDRSYNYVYSLQFHVIFWLIWNVP